MLPRSAAVALTVLVALAAPRNAGAESQGIQSAVVPLTAQNYEKALSQTPISMVLVTDSSNATASADIRREFEFAAILLQRMVTLTSLDLATEKELSALFNVTNSPAIRLVWAGGPVKVYNGDASSKSLTNVALAEWVLFNKKQAEIKAQRPATIQLATALDTARMTSTSTPSLVGYFDGVNSSGYSVFQDVARLYRDNEVVLQIGEMTDKTLLSKLKVKRFPSMSIHNPEVGMTWFPADGNFTVEGIVPWVEASRKQFFTKLHADNVQSVHNQPSAIIFVNLTDQESVERVLALRSVAQELSANISFFYADWGTMGQLAYSLGVAAANKPRLVIWDPSQALHYNFLAAKPLTDKATLRFCQSYLQKKLTPNFRSAPRPQGNDDGVIEVVTDTFKEIVGQPNADVVLCIYSGSASQSGLLLTLYKKVSQSLSHLDSVVFAQMDHDHNDLYPGIPPQVPGVLVFPAGNKDKVQSFSGMASFNGLLQFVESHTSALPDEN